MKRSRLKIGLALSGGGMRAVIFHLGVLKYLAEKKLLKSIEYISSVSGGSICVALMYTNNNIRWVTSEEYLTRVLPSIRRLILNEYIEREKNGVYIRIGESAKDILKDVKMKEWRRLKRVKSSLSIKECKWAENYPTNLRKPKEEEFDRLLQHGYECMLLKNL